MDETYHSPESIASFYLQDGARGLQHWQFMCRIRMRNLFEHLLTVIDEGQRKQRIRAILEEL